jgi:hypothetical protein
MHTVLLFKPSGATGALKLEPKALKQFMILNTQLKSGSEKAQCRSEKAFGSGISNRTYSWDTTLERISRMWIRVQGKARGGAQYRQVGTGMRSPLQFNRGL